MLQYRSNNVLKYVAEMLRQRKSVDSQKNFHNVVNTQIIGR